jgi:hypothetical protein
MLPQERSSDRSQRVPAFDQAWVAPAVGLVLGQDAAAVLDVGALAACRERMPFSRRPAVRTHTSQLERPDWYIRVLGIVFGGFAVFCAGLIGVFAR